MYSCLCKELLAYICSFGAAAMTLYKHFQCEYSRVSAAAVTM